MSSKKTPVRVAYQIPVNSVCDTLTGSTDVCTDNLHFKIKFLCNEVTVKNKYKYNE